jgi:Holliday junction resolvase RusA-like endonuclease
MKIILLKPPSINHIYGYTSRGGFARSYITKEGQIWFAKAIEDITRQNRRKIPIESELEVSIDLYTARRQDVDNIIKPILDALAKAGVMKNDAQIYRVSVEKFKCPVAEQRAEILVEGYEV